MSSSRNSIDPIRELDTTQSMRAFLFKQNQHDFSPVDILLVVEKKSREEKKKEKIKGNKGDIFNSDAKRSIDRSISLTITINEF